MDQTEGCQSRREPMSSRIIAATLFALASAISAQASASPALASSEQSLITGVVRAADGTALPGIEVHFGHNYAAIADASGHYAMSLNTGEMTSLTVTRSRYLQATDLPQDFRLKWPRFALTGDTTIDLTLPPTFQQTFTVLDANGEGLSSGRLSDCCGGFSRAPQAGSATGMGPANVLQRIGSVMSGDSIWVFKDPRYKGLRADGSLALPEGWGQTTLHRELRPMGVGVDPGIRVRLPQTGVVRGAVRSVSGDAQEANLYTTSLAGQATTTPDASGAYTMVVPLGDNDVQVTGQAPNEGHQAFWYAHSATTVSEHTRLPVRLPGWQTTRFEVNDADGLPIFQAGIDGRSDAGGTIGNTGVLLNMSFESSTDYQGVANVPSFENETLDSVVVTAYGHEYGHTWQSTRNFDYIGPTEDDVSVTMPEMTVFAGQNLLPESWQQRLHVRSAGGAVVGHSRGPDLRIHAASNGEAKLVVSGGISEGQGRVPAWFRARTTPGETQGRVHTDLVAPDVVAIDVRLVDRDGNPVVERGLRSATSDVAERAQFFTGLGQARIVQSLSSSSSDDNGLGRMYAFPDPDVNRLEVRDPSTSAILAVVRHLDASTDGRIRVVVGTADNPVIQ